MDKHSKKRALKSAYQNAIELILVGGITGIFVGLVVTLYNLLASQGERFASDVYGFVRANPAFLPLLLLALLLGAFFVGVAIRISGVVRGCGIPQAEGATRGLVRFTWWKDSIAMFAATLIGVFMGLSIGAEGPSVFLGATVGDGVTSITKRNEMVRRYQITGGACAGLAVAANAPLTGMVFAFEEAHKRFTPEVFICSFSSVVFALLTRTLLCDLIGAEHSLSSSFHSFVLSELPLSNYWIVLVAGALCGVLGVCMHKWMFFVRKLIKKIRFKDRYVKFTARVAVAFVVGGLVALIAPPVLGGGHDLIDSLGTLGGTREIQTESVFRLGVVGTLVAVFLLKFLVTGVNVGAGVPCGIFIPIIAMGACVGALVSASAVGIGVMDAKYSDLIVMICLASFFTSIVRAPLTGIILVCEFTWSFAPLLPVVIAVSLGYVIGELSQTNGVYEELLETYERETGTYEHAERELFYVTVQEGSIAEKRTLRDLIFPGNARVTKLVRGSEIIVPDADTVLYKGDLLTIVCRTSEPSRVRDDLLHIFT